jgi:hypothetical protein
MRVSVLVMMAFGAIALTGAAFAQEAPKPLVNPMGAGLVVPAGEAASALAEGMKVPMYAEADLQSAQLGMLQAGGGENPNQMYVLASEEADPTWKPSWFKRVMGRTAPMVRKVIPVSEFMLSPTQKGIMIINVQGSWLQTAQGWFQWTTAIAQHAEFKAWSELYQEAGFASFQLSNARTEKADVVTLGAVELQGVENIMLPAGAKLMVLDARPAALAVRVTGGTCKGAPEAEHEGAQGWVNLFAQSGAPQLLLQPEHCE